MYPRLHDEPGTLITVNHGNINNQDNVLFFELLILYICGEKNNPSINNFH